MSRHENDLKRRKSTYRAQLQFAVKAWPQFDTDNEEVSGADLVEWFAFWRDDTKRLLAIYKRKGPRPVAQHKGTRKLAAYRRSCRDKG
jgi:hypothetical protein